MHPKYSSSERPTFVCGHAKRALLVGVTVILAAPFEAPAADLLVADRLSNSVYRYSASGTLLGTVIANSDDLNQPTGIGISPDAKELYVSSSQNNRVMKYDYNLATGVATNPTIFADASDGLAFPNDIQFSPEGNKIYVANLGGGGVARFNVDGSSAGPPLALPATSVGEASSMTFRAANELLVGAFADGGVAISNSSLSAFSTYLVQPTPAITGATGLMIYGNNLYVSGLFTTSIRRFNLSSGEIDPSWAISGVGFPQDLAVAPDGNGFLAGILGFTNGTGGISRYAFDGSLLGSFAQPGQGGFTEATAFVLVPPPFLGDFNNDGVVNAVDYVVWRNASPTATLPNDATPGKVDVSDYADWRANFGKSTVASAAALGSNPVPEPTSTLLLFIAIVGGGMVRNRN
jgi:sugar lactone lactonase YvrE